MSKLTVHSPLGFPPKIEAKGLAQSVDGLAGKTLFLVDVGFENSDKFMLQMQDWLREHEPTIQTRIARWRSQHEPDPELCALIKQEGDAAILGVGL